MSHPTEPSKAKHDGPVTATTLRESQQDIARPRSLSFNNEDTWDYISVFFIVSLVLLGTFRVHKVLSKQSADSFCSLYANWGKRTWAS